MKICFIGTGYVGLVSGVLFSDFGNTVYCVDNNKKKIKDLENNILPIYEPGLDEIVNKNFNAKRLIFTTDIDKAIQNSDIIFIAVGTPLAKNDQSADLSNVFKVTKTISKNLNKHKTIITKSTVSLGTGDRIEKILSKHNPSSKFDVVSNPEFLREGEALRDFRYPDRIVIGTNNPKKISPILKKLYDPIIKKGAKFIVVSRKAAELIKYAANAFLATKITFINEIANLCEKTGINVDDIAEGIGTDQRIGSRFLRAGPAYGGSCFPKDTKALAKTSDDFKVNLSLVKNVIRSNGNRNNLIVQKILKIAKQNNLKKIGFLGVTFKANTDDMRDSSSLFIIPKLLKNNLKISYYEPTGSKRILSKYKKIKYCINQKELITNCDFVIIHSDWDEFKNIDFNKVSKNKKLSICDLRNLYHPDEFKNKKIKYYSIGRPFHG